MAKDLSTRPERAFFDYTKDRNYIHSLTLEMQEVVAGTFVFYWALSEEDTQVDPLYNETVGARVFLAPLKIWAHVDFMEHKQVTTGSHVERTRQVKLRLFKDHLETVQLSKPKSGDIVQVGQEYYEIIKLTEDNPLFGDTEDLYSYEMLAEQARPYDISALPPLAANHK
tara:strand:- start:4873 stop:5379 length:507 start_codon:yes stop_codon:yes gene_type:complete